MKTVFEKIVAREIPARILYETKHTLAFLDHEPITKGHTLVICKKPYKNIYEVPNNVLQDMIVVVKKVAKAIKKAFNADGINLLNNNEAPAGQVVFHYHIHVAARFKNDEKGFNFPHTKQSEETLDSWHKKLKEALK